jgi:hypothetical protein
MIEVEVVVGISCGRVNEHAFEVLDSLEIKMSGFCSICLVIFIW